MSIPRVLVWRKALLEGDHDLDKITRLVLLALQHWMDDEGKCFPTVATITKATGLSRPSVTEHLNRAEAAGWIERDRGRAVGGQRWRLTHYRARIPTGLEGGKAGYPPTDERWESGLPTSAPKVGNPVTEGGQNEASKVGNGVAQNSLVNSLMNSTTPSVCAPSPRTRRKGGGSSDEPTWSRQACEAWTERFGGTAPGGRIGKALKPLVTQHGPDAVLATWRKYLAEEPERFARPEDFAGKYGLWAGTNGNGRRQGNTFADPTAGGPVIDPNGPLAGWES